MDRKVFLDTAFILAYIFKDDKFNSNAIKLKEEIKIKNIEVITTELILIELANSLSKLRFRKEAILTINELRKATKVLEVDNRMLKNAWGLFTSREDKEWGIIDCFSFIAMQEYEVKQALSTDKHFEQAGFEILLK